MTSLFMAQELRAAGPNLVQRAIGDLETASSLLRRPGSPVRGLDIRELAGGAHAWAAGAAAEDIYCAAIDAGLRRLPGLTRYGYTLRRAVQR